MYIYDDLHSDVYTKYILLLQLNMYELPMVISIPMYVHIYHQV